MLLIRITLPWVSSGLAKVPGASKKRITRRPRQGFGRQRLVIWTHTVETSSCPFMRTHGMWFFFQCLVFYVGNRQLIHIYFHVGSHTSNFKLNLIHLIFNVNGQSNPTFIGYHSATQEYRPEHVSGQLEERIAPSALSDCISMRAQMIRLAEQRIKEVTSYFGGFWSRVYIY